MSIALSGEPTLHNPHPVLKWAGGKGQLLPHLLAKTPALFNRYLEPFFGGGALFFALQPLNAVISDSNPELINLYSEISQHVNQVIKHLKRYSNTEEEFYSVRQQQRHELSPAEAAARTIYLNKTCYNGLYRVNKEGQFNVPYGRYKNPRICDEEGLQMASSCLKRARIVHGDFAEVLQEYAQPGDFIFLDPPYIPVSEYSDFKRYTKDQFSEEDHRRLAQQAIQLQDMGCTVVLTNSNHPLVHQLYKDFHREIVPTKRHISCQSSSRIGEDVIVSSNPTDISSASPAYSCNQSLEVLCCDRIPLFQPENIVNTSNSIPSSADVLSATSQLSKFPSTRFMGSKNKLLSALWEAVSGFRFDTVLDLFSGSGIVGYMFKCYGKQVSSNDYLFMSSSISRATIENSTVTLNDQELTELFEAPDSYSDFVRSTFSQLYFSDEDNHLIDIIRANIRLIPDVYKQAIATSALVRACIKKRPRGVFTYVGTRYDDGRKDLRKSFKDQFIEAVACINNAVFDNGKQNKSYNGDAMLLNVPHHDLVYIDPPYYSPLSDNEYVRRYHFVEGLARNWEGVTIQEHTKTKKFKSYPTPFSSRNGASAAFAQLFQQYADSILIISYSSNSLPTMDEILAMLSEQKKNVTVIPVEYRYSFGNQNHKIGDNNNSVQEYIFIGY